MTSPVVARRPNTHDGSMVLLYMVCHGSHQYTPFMLVYMPYMDPIGYDHMTVGQNPVQPMGFHLRSVAELFMADASGCGPSQWLMVGLVLIQPINITIWL